MKLEIGMKVKTKLGKMAYYDDAFVEKGSVGTVGSVNCPYVNKQGTFNCVDFVRDGKKVRCSFKNKELIFVENNKKEKDK